MKIHKKKLLSLFFSAFLIFGFVIPSQASNKLTQSQQVRVEKVFTALASSDPDLINTARKNVSGAANLAMLMAQNYFATEKYFRSVDSVGRSLGNIPANSPAGSAKIRNGQVALTTAVPGFTGTYTNFKFNKQGKITSWSIKSQGGSKYSVSARFKDLPQETWRYGNNVKAVYWGKGVQLDTGIIFHDSLNRWIVQLSITNVAGDNNTKSLITTTGKYQSPDKKLYSTTGTPAGCFGNGQTIYYTATIPTGAIISNGILGILEIPMSNGCVADDSNRLEVAIKP